MTDNKNWKENAVRACNLKNTSWAQAILIDYIRKALAELETKDAETESLVRAMRDATNSLDTKLKAKDAEIAKLRNVVCEMCGHEALDDD